MDESKTFFISMTEFYKEPFMINLKVVFAVLVGKSWKTGMMCKKLGEFCIR